MGTAAAPIMMGISLAATAASTAMSAIGQSQQAAQQAQIANYQAQVARNAQTTANWNAENAKKQGQAEEDQQRQKTSLLIGAQRAALAAQGGDITSGSTIDVIGDTARAGELDAETIRSNAALKAWGYKVQASNAGAQAGLYTMQAADATANLPYTIGSSLLSGVSSIAGKWASWERSDPSTKDFKQRPSN